jgi:hypothetical protein
MTVELAFRHLKLRTPTKSAHRTLDQVSGQRLDENDQNLLQTGTLL